jgi:hypothetical protein
VVTTGGPLVFASFAAAVIWLGVVMMLGPACWFGPSWHYFTEHGAPILPAGGFGMGLCLTLLGALQLLAVWLRAGPLTLGILFFLSGFTFWTAGIILGAEGLLGHQGLMEAPLMILIGAFKFVHCAVMVVQDRKNRRDSKCTRTTR